MGKRGRKPMTKEEFKAQLTKRFGNSFIGDMEKLLSIPYLYMSAVARKYGVSKQYLSKWVFPRIMNCDSSWRQIKSQNIQAFREEMRQNRLRPSEEENMNRFQKFWFSKRAVEEECKKRGFSVSSEQWVLLVNGKKVSVKSAFMSILTPSRLDPYYGFRIPRYDFDVLVCHLVDINRFFIFKNTDLQGWNMLIKSPLLEQTKKAQERIDKHMDKWHVFEEKQA